MGAGDIAQHVIPNSPVEHKKQFGTLLPQALFLKRSRPRNSYNLHVFNRIWYKLAERLICWLVACAAEPTAPKKRYTRFGIMQPPGRNAMTVTELLEQAKALSPHERKELVKRLIDTLDVAELPPA